MLSQIHRWLPLKSRTSIPRRAYTCLCILGVPRSGSNLLRGLLNDHPDILVHNEVFCAIAPVRETSLLWEKRPRVPYQKGHIAPYLEEHVFPKDPEGKKVIGFKLFPSHIDYLERGEREWEAIRGIPDLRVLLLRRENYLDIALSAELANRSMQWISTGQSPPEPAPMVLPINVLLWYFHTMEKHYRTLEERTRGLDVLPVTYRDLAGQTQETMSNVQRWLGVDPLLLKPDPPMFKQRMVPRSTVILNYEELRQRVQREHPEWLRFFLEEDLSAVPV